MESFDILGMRDACEENSFTNPSPSSIVDECYRAHHQTNYTFQHTYPPAHGHNSQHQSHEVDDQSRLQSQQINQDHPYQLYHVQHTVQAISSSSGSSNGRQMSRSNKPMSIRTLNRIQHRELNENILKW